MTLPMSEKEKMLTMLTEIYDQLEELESVLEASFSNHRLHMNSEEQEKLSVTFQLLSDIGEKSVKLNPMAHEEFIDAGTVPKPFKLELGF